MGSRVPWLRRGSTWLPLVRICQVELSSAAEGVDSLSDGRGERASAHEHLPDPKLDCPPAGSGPTVSLLTRQSNLVQDEAENEDDLVQSCCRFL